MQISDEKHAFPGFDLRTRSGRYLQLVGALWQLSNSPRVCGPRKQLGSLDSLRRKNGVSPLVKKLPSPSPSPSPPHGPEVQKGQKGIEASNPSVHAGGSRLPRKVAGPRFLDSHRRQSVYRLIDSKPTLTTIDCGPRRLRLQRCDDSLFPTGVSGNEESIQLDCSREPAVEFGTPSQLLIDLVGA